MIIYNYGPVRRGISKIVNPAKGYFHEGFSPREITLSRVDSFGYPPTHWAVTVLLYRTNTAVQFGVRKKTKILVFSLACGIRQKLRTVIYIISK